MKAMLRTYRERFLKVFSVVSIAGFSFVGAETAQAQITPLSCTRRVYAGAFPFMQASAGEVISTTNFLPFHATAQAATADITAFASQHSTITPAAITGNGQIGSVETGPFLGDFFRESSVDMRFRVSEPTAFTIGIDAFSGGLGSEGEMVVGIFPTTPGPSLFAVVYPFNMSLSDVLMPGDYRFRVLADDYGNNAHANFTFSWYFAVPSPTTLPAFCAAVWLAARRRRPSAPI